MSIADKLTTIAENEQKVYDAGKQVQYDEFWDSFQNKGKRTNYTQGFRGFLYGTYNPKYDIVNAECASIYYSNSSITDTKVAIINPTTIQTMFWWNTGIRTIRTLQLMADTVLTQAFQGCQNIESMDIQGTIGQNGFNVQWATKLNRESLLKIINALADYSEDTSGTEWLITLGSANVAKLTDTEIQMIESKGWTYA